jgi:hypothetical protein
MQMHVNFNNCIELHCVDRAPGNCDRTLRAVMCFYEVACWTAILHSGSIPKQSLRTFSFNPISFPNGALPWL